MLESSVKKFPLLRNIQLKYRGGSRLDFYSWEIANEETRPAERIQLGDHHEALALRALLKGAYHLGRKLRGLQVNPLALDFFDCEYHLVSQLRDSVQNLQDVHLRIPSVYHRYRIASEVRSSHELMQRRTKLLSEGYLYDFLTAMPHLRKINLDCASSMPTGVPLELSQALGGIEWYALQHLELSGFDTPEPYLLDVIQRHTKTLTNVFLFEITTYNPSIGHCSPTELSSFSAILPDTWLFDWFP